MSKPPSRADGEVVYVRQGEFAASGRDDVVLTAILGSCVATCLYDESVGVGGMNHILLPHDVRGGAGSDLETVNLMELLINELMKLGADRRRLKGKLFGGSSMMESSAQIGRMNAAFALEFLEAEGIPCIAQSLGGDSGRKIRFWPVGGRARQFLLERQEVETVIRPTPPPARTAPAGDDIELF